MHVYKTIVTKNPPPPPPLVIYYSLPPHKEGIQKIFRLLAPGLPVPGPVELVARRAQCHCNIAQTPVPLPRWHLLHLYCAFLVTVRWLFLLHNPEKEIKSKSNLQELFNAFTSFNRLKKTLHIKDDMSVSLYPYK